MAHVHKYVLTACAVVVVYKLVRCHRRYGSEIHKLKTLLDPARPLMFACLPHNSCAACETVPVGK